MGTVYRDSLTRQGYGKAVEAVLAANAPKFTGVVPADAQELLEQLIVYGTPPEARRRLGRWHEAGAAFPVLLLRPNLTPEERALTLEAFRPMLLEQSRSKRPRTRRQCDARRLGRSASTYREYALRVRPSSALPRRLDAASSSLQARFRDPVCVSIVGALLRNRIVHDYFNVDLDLVWQIAEMSCRAGIRAGPLGTSR